MLATYNCLISIADHPSATTSQVLLHRLPHSKFSSRSTPFTRHEPTLERPHPHTSLPAMRVHGSYFAALPNCNNGGIIYSERIGRPTARPCFSSPTL